MIQKSEKQAPGNLDAYVVFWLHKKRAYDTGSDEEKFICEIQEWYQGREGKKVDRKEIHNLKFHLTKEEVFFSKGTNYFTLPENTKICMEEGPEYKVPHFYADYNLVK